MLIGGGQNNQKYSAGRISIMRAFFTHNAISFFHVALAACSLFLSEGEKVTLSRSTRFLSGVVVVVVGGVVHVHRVSQHARRPSMH